MTAAAPVAVPAEPVAFAVVGSGWRTEFFLRVAEALPERFRVTGVLARRPERGRELEQRWGVRTVSSLPELLDGDRPAFVVVSVTRDVAPDLIEQVAAAGLPVLTETPPGLDLAALHRVHALTGARIQVAEQYHLQPLVRVQLELARSGRLGAVHYAHCSLAHDYHGVSVLRRALGVGFEAATIRARAFDSPLTAGPDRTGDPAQQETVTARQVIAELDFGDRLGIYDFSTEHYFSWIRTRELLVRGTRGEVRGDQVRYLEDFRTPVRVPITRSTAGVDGNHEGAYLRGLLVGDRWLYHNPFRPARLNDDELAVAECLVRMAAYADGGPDLYSLAEAAQDHYLQLLVRQAVDTGEPVRTAPQPWTP